MEDNPKIKSQIRISKEIAVNQPSSDQGGPSEEEPLEAVIPEVLNTVASASGHAQASQHSSSASVYDQGEGACGETKQTVGDSGLLNEDEHPARAVSLQSTSEDIQSNGSVASSGDCLHCNECGDRIYKIGGDKWMRCTLCGYHNVCWDCHRVGKHSEHASQMTVYTWLNEKSDHPETSCSGCGFLYDIDNPKFKVKQCAACGDYSICKKCHDKELHNHHKYMMTPVLRTNYERSLIK